MDKTQEHNRCIIHLDIDCFYAQVEMLYNPELRDKPLGIQQKNIIITTNYLARQLGVPKSTYVADAVKKWPQLVLVNGEDLTKYRQKSYEISEFLQKYSPNVERLGFDENFIDVSDLVSWRLKDKCYKQEFIGYLQQSSSSKTCCKCGCYLRLQVASQIASDVREALNKELGITSSAGIAHNKLLAKLIGATHKPNLQTTILPEQALEFMSSLRSVRCIPGVGLSTGNTLQRLGITSVVDLQTAERGMLGKEFGSSTADFLINSSLGRDDSPVIKFDLPQAAVKCLTDAPPLQMQYGPEQTERSMSDEDSFQCCNTFNDAVNRIKGLIHSLLKRVSDDGRVPQTVRLTIRRVYHGAQTWEKYRKRESRQCAVPRTIFTGIHSNLYSLDTACELMMPILMNLFQKVVDVSKPFHLTLINIGFANLMKSMDEKSKIISYFLKSPKKNIDQFEEKSVPTNKVNFDDQKSEFQDSGNEKRSLFKQQLNSESEPADLHNQTVLDSKSHGSSEFVFKKRDNLSEHEAPEGNKSSRASLEHMSDNDSTFKQDPPYECPVTSDDSISNTAPVSKKQVPLTKRPSDCQIEPHSKCRKIMDKNCNKTSILHSNEKKNPQDRDQIEEAKLVKLAKALSEHSEPTIEATQLLSPSSTNSEAKSILKCSQGIEMSQNLKTMLKPSSGKTPDKNHQIFFPKSFKTNTKLPAGIDPQVFSELPRNIQSEILAHIAMASSPKPSITRAITTENKTQFAKNGKEKTKEHNKEASSILKYFSRNTP